MTPDVNARMSAPRRDIPRLRTHSARPNPKGTNSKTFRQSSKVPALFNPLCRRKGERAPGYLEWMTNVKGNKVKNKIPAIARIRIRLDQSGEGIKPCSGLAGFFICLDKRSPGEQFLSLTWPLSLPVLCIFHDVPSEGH